MAAYRTGDEEGPTTPPRFWTVEEANGRLDALREELPRLRAMGARLHKIHTELQRLSSFWGKELEASDHPDRALRDRLNTEWRAIGDQLKSELERLQAEGIEIKDLDSGLVDFYAYEAGEVVFLCWQRGEDDVGFYHTLDGGYRSRRPVGSLPRYAAAPSRNPSG